MEQYAFMSLKKLTLRKLYFRFSLQNKSFLSFRPNEASIQMALKHLHTPVSGPTMKVLNFLTGLKPIKLPCVKCVESKNHTLVRFFLDVEILFFFLNEI